MKSSKNPQLVLPIASFLAAVGLLVARVVYPEMLWLTGVAGAALVGLLGLVLNQNRKALRSRSAAFGLYSVTTTLLVIAIVGVLNFLAARYPAKLDLTRNRRNTLSEQTEKLVRGLKDPVKAIYFAKLTQREQLRPLLDSYRALSPRFEIEFVDPDKEAARAKQAGVKKYNTLQLISGTRDSRVEEPTEEKITNTLIKLTQDRTQTLCALTGHGERPLAGLEADGYDSVRKNLLEQAYQTREVNLIQEGRIPEACDALGIFGPSKAFFAPELKLLDEYLANGGRAIVALDADLKGKENAPELVKLLEPWHVKPVQALIVDPVSQRFGGDAAVPLLVTYSKDSPITKEFQTNCFFPLARPLEVIPGAPAVMNANWLAKTTPQAWGETNAAQIAAGAVKMDLPGDAQGPLTTAVSVEGKLKDSKAKRNTRLVVFGTSGFANNNYARFGGNLDFFLNSVSWVLENENQISIRPREEGPGKVELSQKQGSFVFLLTVIIVPLLIAVAGVVIWTLRRKL